MKDYYFAHVCLLLAFFLDISALILQELCPYFCPYFDVFFVIVPILSLFWKTIVHVPILSLFLAIFLYVPISKYDWVKALIHGCVYIWSISLVYFDKRVLWVLERGTIPFINGWYIYHIMPRSWVGTYSSWPITSLDKSVMRNLTQLCIVRFCILPYCWGVLWVMMQWCTPSSRTLYTKS